MAEWMRATDHGDPMHLMRVMIGIYDQFESQGLKPGAEKWVTFARPRKRIFDLVEATWRDEKDIDETYSFPWCEDFISSCWTEIRKWGEEKDVKCRNELFGGITSLVPHKAEQTAASLFME